MTEIPAYRLTAVAGAEREEEREEERGERGGVGRDLIEAEAKAVAEYGAKGVRWEGLVQDEDVLDTWSA